MGRRDLPLEDYVEQRTLISAFVEANPGFLLPDPEGGPRRSVPYRLRGLDPKAGAGAPYAWLAGTREDHSPRPAVDGVAPQQTPPG